MRSWYPLIVLSALLGCGLPAAAAPTTAMREAAELVTKKFAKDVGQETADSIAVRLERLTAKHGDDAIEATRKVGPQAMQLLEKAGAEGADAARLIAKYGDEGLFLARRPESLSLFARFGDDAARALLKHPGYEPIIEKLGKEGAQALQALDSQQALHLAAMATGEAQDLAKIGRTKELLGVIGKYGNKAMDFVWTNKGALAVGAALTAFLADPDPFINGTADITKYAVQETAGVAKHAIDGVTAPASQAAKSVGERVNWTLLLGLCIPLIVGWLCLRTYLLARQRRRRK